MPQITGARWTEREWLWAGRRCGCVHAATFFQGSLGAKSVENSGSDHVTGRNAANLLRLFSATSSRFLLTTAMLPKCLPPRARIGHRFSLEFTANLVLENPSVAGGGEWPVCGKEWGKIDVMDSVRLWLSQTSASGRREMLSLSPKLEPTFSRRRSWYAAFVPDMPFDGCT